MTELLDCETILSGNEHWSKLDEEWGTPIDLETEDDYFVPPTFNQSGFSTLDLRKPTFDSAVLLSRKKPKLGLNYKEFIQNLDIEDTITVKTSPSKQFYFVGGEIISAVSVDEICENIDDVFKSVEKLSATTSTVRAKRKAKSVPRIPDIVECSFSVSDLSFDETYRTEKEKSDGDDVDRYIDELFHELSVTIQKSRQSLDQLDDRSVDLVQDSVTTLVRKFTTFLESPVIKCSPRRKRQCCDRFKDLAEFWRSKTDEF